MKSERAESEAIIYEKFDGEELTWENDTEGRWKEYFVQRLNWDERRERIGENGKVVMEVVREEIIGALKKMKGSKAADMDDIGMDILKSRGISITDRSDIYIKALG